ncbi:MAG TPA: peptide-methionine (S)-S-oxide reductase MsrA [Mycobacteriales bacterium]|nr:peptide-methionine (S)-S-oxide reductase MsrA [Mycobacteriales bacterium]
MKLFGKKLDLPSVDQALPGRDEPMRVPERHEVLGTPLTGPWPAGLEVAYFAMGCFWGSEELYWQVPGVHSTAVGYQGGMTPNPTYEEACSGRTGHTEAVQVVYDPAVVSYEELLKVFWEHHDSTQGMRQGNDIGTQYRSAVYTTSEAQLKSAQASRDTYQVALTRSGLDAITTEILPAGPFYYAEPYHQQYLHKNPHGYRCHSETGVPYPG